MVLERGLRGEEAGVVDVLQFLEDVAARQHVHGEATTSFLQLIILLVSLKTSRREQLARRAIRSAGAAVGHQSPSVRSRQHGNHARKHQQTTTDSLRLPASTRLLLFQCCLRSPVSLWLEKCSQTAHSFARRPHAAAGATCFS